MTRHAIARFVAFASVFAAAVTLAGQGPTESALAAAGAYLADYRERVAGVVLEEKYLQQAAARVVVARELRSDLAIMGDPDHGWVEFRDVFEVDGKPVRDRQDRVVELFTSPSPDSLEQAKRIVAEGARFNLNADGVQFDRTINLPMAALMYLRTGNQSRSRFQRDSADSIDGHRAIVIRFEERATPRLIGSADNAPARGKFWIEPETGRVLRTQLQIDSRRGTTDIAASITVDYREHEALGLWLPASMVEEYVFSGATRQVLATISGRALYSNARKFRVEIDEETTEPAPPAS